MKGEKYNGASRNCSNLSKVGVESVLGMSVDSEENIQGHISTTPNKLFQTTSKSPNASVIKSPGDKVNNSFIKGVGGTIGKIISGFLN